jgi:hypothetical protein
LLQNVELMLQHQDFGFKPSSRLEAVAQHADEQEGNCEHPSTMDGVFGTDTCRNVVGIRPASQSSAIEGATMGVIPCSAGLRIALIHLRAPPSLSLRAFSCPSIGIS